MDNQTQVSEFILLGLPQKPLQRQVLFSLSCILYLSGCLGNLLTILAIIASRKKTGPNSTAWAAARRKK